MGVVHNLFTEPTWSGRSIPEPASASAQHTGNVGALDPAPFPLELASKRCLTSQTSVLQRKGRLEKLRSGFYG